MQLAIPVETIDVNNVFFAEKKRNVVIDGDFVKILYSNESVEINELYVWFESEANRDNLCLLESNILTKYKEAYEILTKTPLFVLKQQCCRSTYNVVKISGVWENDTHYGITCKFLFVKKL